jgi:integrase
MYMSMEIRPEDFNSPLRNQIMDFISERRTCGSKYISEYHHLRRFDKFLCSRMLDSQKLPRELVLEWIAWRENESPLSQKCRISVASLFAKFLVNRDIDAFVLPRGMCRMAKWNFCPYIFSHEEIGKIIFVADNWKPVQNAPFLHLVMGELFRVIYTCGLRDGEAARLKLSETDLDRGILVIRQGKFRKDRLVPMADSTTARLRKYLERLPLKGPSDPLFPNRAGKHYNPSSLYSLFRQLLWKLRIPHGGRGKGPRLHDLRHTFAVHRLESWIKEGVDLNSKLPLLSAYLGHVGIAGTQRYLKLTPGAFPDITRPLDLMFAKVYNKEGQNEHN